MNIGRSDAPISPPQGVTMTLRNTIFAVVSLIGLGMPSVASAEVCPATNVVGTIQWVLSSTRASIQPEGTECAASIKLKRAVPSPGIPSTVHYMKDGTVVKSVRVDISGSTGAPVSLGKATETSYDSVVVMANYN